MNSGKYLLNYVLGLKAITSKLDDSFQIHSDAILEHHSQNPSQLNSLLWEYLWLWDNSYVTFVHIKLMCGSNDGTCTHVISLSDFHKSSRNPPCCHFLGLKSSEIKHFRPTWSSYKVKYYCHEKPFSPFFPQKIRPHT